MTVSRVAIVFDDRPRPETTGTYCLQALRELINVEHVLPDRLADVDAAGFDCFLFVDDGLLNSIPTGLPATAYWAIDTHIEFKRSLSLARQVDRVFAAQQEGTERLRAAGIDSAVWLPLACDPSVHRPHDVDKRWDVCFVGHLFPERNRLLSLLRRRFPSTYTGRHYFDEMAQVFSSARIVFNRSLAGDVNMRVFEGLACGSLLMTDRLAANGLAELFTDGRHLATYESDEELLEKIAWYLDHAEVREQVAAAGRREVLARHTYRQRMQSILDSFAAANPTQQSANHSAARVSMKDDGYFGFARPEVVALIPPSARRVLDIGCGVGRLGQAVKRRQPCEVVGIELNANAATAARDRLDEVLQGNVEMGEIDFPRNRFDCVVCADVLEHLRDPMSVLTRIRDWLDEGGCLVASIPNVRHHTVVRSLLAGNWSYEPAGLLDDDHVRFFTRREIEKLLFRAGFGRPALSGVPGPGYEEWVERGRPREVQAGSLHFSGKTPEEAEEFYVYQYLLRAEPRRNGRAVCGNGAETAADGITPVDQVESLQRLSDEYRWPDEKPDVPTPTANLGWLGDGAREVLQQVLNDRTALVVELGAWLGLSTRFITEFAPNATVVTIDHWQGSQEHWGDPRYSELLPQLYETFLALCWRERDRIVPLKMTTEAGLRRVAEYGLSPDVIYIDADHSYAAVAADVELCRSLFPQAVLVGDDYDAPGVLQAVHEGAERDGIVVDTTGVAWRGWKLLPQSGSTMRETAARDDGVTSIIIVTHNQWAYTRQCLESIRYRTDEAYELIVVDNGSDDGTPEFLQAKPEVQLIANPINRGFPAAVNQGLRVARGTQVLLLNNDTLVTTGWLRRMLDALHRDEHIGLVGPCSNNVSGLQQIEVEYDDLAQLDGFAWDLGLRRQGEIADVDRLVGYCLLIRRAVVDEVGLLDERFGIGCYEDDDYCRRSLEAGYRAVIARDSFVHHFGSQTFRAAGIDLAAVLDENRNKFEEKWSNQRIEQSTNALDAEDEPQTATVAHSSSTRPRLVIGRHTAGGLLLEEKQLALSLCMIVRDNETTIRPALASIRPWVDEIVVVDTGSTDRTPEICREHGARLFHFPWCDDFSAARNESLKYARGEWIFWMDSDDTIDETNGRKLRTLVEGAHPGDRFGYVMQVHCPGADDKDHDVTVVDHVKLFRNRPDLRFEHRIHEQIIPAIRRAGGDVAFTDIYVVHSGADHTEEGRKRKLERDLRILEQDLRERPDHPFVLFNLGMTYTDVPDHDRAVDYLRRCLTVSDPVESHVRKAYALLVGTLHQAGRTDEAWENVQRGLELFPDDKELLFRAGIVQHHQGRLAEAATVYLQLLNGNSQRHFSSVDAGVAGFKARHNLALVYEELERPDDAEEQWRLAVAERPLYRAGWLGLGETLLKQQRFDETGELAWRLKAQPELNGTGAVLAARLLERQGDAGAARRELETAVENVGSDTQPLFELSRLLFERFQPGDALETLLRLADADPQDAAVQHNLATAYEQHDRLEEAVAALRRSLDLRPDSPATSRQLAALLRRLQRAEESGDAR